MSIFQVFEQSIDNAVGELYQREPEPEQQGKRLKIEPPKPLVQLPKDVIEIMLNNMSGKDALAWAAAGPSYLTRIINSLINTPSRDERFWRPRIQVEFADFLQFQPGTDLLNLFIASPYPMPFKRAYLWIHLFQSRAVKTMVESMNEVANQTTTTLLYPYRFEFENIYSVKVKNRITGEEKSQDIGVELVRYLVYPEPRITLAASFETWSIIEVALFNGGKYNAFAAEGDGEPFLPDEYNTFVQQGLAYILYYYLEQSDDDFLESMFETFEDESNNYTEMAKQILSAFESNDVTGFQTMYNYLQEDDVRGEEYDYINMMKQAMGLNRDQKLPAFRTLDTTTIYSVRQRFDQLFDQGDGRAGALARKLRFIDEMGYEWSEQWADIPRIFRVYQDNTNIMEQLMQWYTKEYPSILRSKDDAKVILIGEKE